MDGLQFFLCFNYRVVYCNKSCFFRRHHRPESLPESS